MGPDFYPTLSLVFAMIGFALALWVRNLYVDRKDTEHKFLMLRNELEWANDRANRLEYGITQRNVQIDKVNARVKHLEGVLYGSNVAAKKSTDFKITESGADEGLNIAAVGALQSAMGQVATPEQARAVGLDSLRPFKRGL